MQKAEHVKIFSGKKLIVEGNYWVTRVGKCVICGVIEKLPDDLHCDECREKLYKTEDLDEI